MREIGEKEFCLEVDDEIAGGIFDMLVKLMMMFEQKGYVNVHPMVEYSYPDAEERAWEAAEKLKEAVYDELVKLGLDVEGDGRSW